MSKTFDECCVEVGFNRRSTPPELVSQWIGYSAGDAIPCNSMNAAMQYSLYECVVTPESKIAHDEYFSKRRIQEVLARDRFLKYLRLDYINLSNDLYDACYEEACVFGQEDGLDVVADCLKTIVTFVLKIQKIK